MAERTAEDIFTTLNSAGVVCGPVYTVADIVDDPQVQARDMLVAHDDPEIGTFTGPGIVPKLSRTPGGVRWSVAGNPGRTTTTSTPACSGSTPPRSRS